MSQEAQISMPVAKASAAIASAVGAQLIEGGNQASSVFAELFTITWPNLASLAAFLFTTAMLIEFCWKKFWRPFLEAWGLIKPVQRRVYTAREWAEKMAEQDSTRVPLE